MNSSVGAITSFGTGVMRAVMLTTCSGRRGRRKSVVSSKASVMVQAAVASNQLAGRTVSPSSAPWMRARSTFTSVL